MVEKIFPWSSGRSDFFGFDDRALGGVDGTFVQVLNIVPGVDLRFTRQIRNEDFAGRVLFPALRLNRNRDEEHQQKSRSQEDRLPQRGHAAFGFHWDE